MLLVLTNLTIAQPFFSEVKVFAGPSLLSIRDNDPYNQYGQPKIGYAIGFAAIHNASNHLAINTRLELERKGYKLEFTSLIPPDLYNSPPTNILPPVPMTVKINLNNNYLTVSLLPQYSIGNELRVIIGAGPYYGRLMKSQITRTVIHNNTVKEKIVANHKESSESYDLGLSSYFGFALKEFLKIRLFLFLDYKHGIKNIIKEQTGLDPIKNNSLIITIGIEPL